MDEINEINEAITQRKITRKEIAALLGINKVSVWRRLSGRVAWRPLEIEAVETHLFKSRLAEAARKMEEKNDESI